MSCTSMTDKTADRARSRPGRREIGGASLIKVKQQRMDEDVFMEKHKEVLAIWPTGKEVDLEEAVAYQKALPDSKRFHKVLQKVPRRTPHRRSFPDRAPHSSTMRSRLIRSLNELGIHLLPLTTDSYTRNLQLDKVEKGLEESTRTGKAALNGYPIVNHGVKTNRKVVEACDGALDPRSSRVGQALVAEIAFASGMNAFPNSFFGWIAGYDKKATVEECIETAQYTRRLIGYYADHGVIITTDTHGWLPNFVIPMSVNMATQIIESLDLGRAGREERLPAGEHAGLPGPRPGRHARLCPSSCGTISTGSATPTSISPGVFGSQSPLFPFPQEMGSAFGYIGYTALTAALGGCDVVSVKTVDEAAGVPSIDSHRESYLAAQWILGCWQRSEAGDRQRRHPPGREGGHRRSARHPRQGHRAWRRRHRGGYREGGGGGRARLAHVHQHPRSGQGARASGTTRAPAATSISATCPSPRRSRTSTGRRWPSARRPRAARWTTTPPSRTSGP